MTIRKISSDEFAALLPQESLKGLIEAMIGYTTEKGGRPDGAFQSARLTIEGVELQFASDEKISVDTTQPTIRFDGR